MNLSDAFGNFGANYPDENVHELLWQSSIAFKYVTAANRIIADAVSHVSRMAALADSGLSTERYLRCFLCLAITASATTAYN